MNLQDRQCAWALEHGRMPTFKGSRKLRSQQKLCERQGFTIARHLFIQGAITASQAAGMAALDRDFVAGCTLRCVQALDAAHDVVDQKWKLLAIERGHR